MPQVSRTTVKKVNAETISDAEDLLAAEEPMEIRLEYGSAGKRVQKNISVTMRTPGNDTELAVGFLFTEAIINSATQVVSFVKPKADNENIILVSLAEDATPAIEKTERNFYTTSSCGVCGKASIEAVKTACNIPESFDRLRVPASLIYKLPDRLRKQQEVFENTGGLHACALFDMEGKLLLVREDVGRHNALDKLIGAELSFKIIKFNKIS